MDTARSTALQALERFRRTGAWSDEALDSLLKKNKLQRRDAALCSRIFYGVLQNMALLDFYIGEFTKISKLEPKVLDILRIGAYQLVFLDKIPQSAAVNESVELARALGYARAAGLCNAVLRRTAEAVSKGLPEVPGKGTAKQLSIKYSHPQWLVDEYIAALGFEDAEKLLISQNGQCPIYAQVNTLRISPRELISRLSEKEIDVKAHDTFPDCLVLGSVGNLEELQEFNDGFFYIQDPGAKLAALATSFEPGMTLIDCCAAPGGKSFAAAMMTGDEGKILACDIAEKKLKRIMEGAKRLGLHSISTAQCDAREPLDELKSTAHCVIVDAPCSGLGVIRKKPEIRYKDKDELEGLPKIQLDILRGASSYVKSGGVLVYSTCTVRRSENEEVIREFLKGSEDFSLDGFSQAPEGMITLWPHINDTDGFFVCRMIRN